MKQALKASLCGLLLAFAFGSASAAPCTVVDPATNPDASLTNSTGCGLGNGDSTDTNSNVTLQENITSLSWTQIDKNENSGDGSTGALLSTNVPDGTSGSWGFNGVSGYDSYLIVIKDGGYGQGQGLEPGLTAPTTTWYWFIVDLSAGCASGNTFNGTTTYCGTWSMYGYDTTSPFTPKGISHLSLYGAKGSGEGCEPGGCPVPEPSSLALLGLGLAGLGLIRRRRGAK